MRQEPVDGAGLAVVGGQDGGRLLRVASALRLIIALLTDILGTGTGMGRLLVVSQQRFEAAVCWGLLLVVGAIGGVASAILAQVDVRLAQRRASTHRRDGKHFGRCFGSTSLPSNRAAENARREQ